MSAVTGSDHINIEIKQEIDDQKTSLEDIERESEEHKLFVKTEPSEFDGHFIKLENYQDFVHIQAEVDPLDVGPFEDAESCIQSSDPENRINSKNEPTEESASTANPKKHDYECPVCKKTFLHYSKFTRHVRTHEEKPDVKLYECSVCKKKYARTSTLVIHFRSHTGEKPYECEECKKTFPSSSAYSKHLLVHTGEKRYECTVCEQKFSSSSNLTTHLRTHTGEKPFECKICKQRFSVSSTLSRHARVHTGDKPYECDVCKKKFGHSTSLVKHLRVHTSK